MRLHRLRYSPYARKVQLLLEMLPVPHEVVEVPYGNREELARLTGGYIYVPVLELDDGRVMTESRDICEHLLARAEAARLVPSPLEGPIWAFHDYVDGPLEDVLFRIASPAIRDQWPTAFERALYVLVKERKFGAGCVDAWLRDQEAWIDRAGTMLAPTVRTLSKVPFLFGEAPTFADLALYGQLAMIEAGDPALLHRLDPALVTYARRLEAARPGE